MMNGLFTLTEGYFNAAFPAVTDATNRVTNLTIADGIFNPSNAVELFGDSTFTWQNGRILRGIDASNGTGVDTIALQPASGVTLSFDGSLLVGFEALGKTGAGTFIQSGTLALGGSGAITISAGTYTIGDGFELQGNSLIVSGSGTMLDGDGMVVLGSGASTFTLSGGTVSVAVDLGAGGDSFTLSGGTLGAAVDLGAGANTFTWSSGTLGAAGSVAGGADTDTLVVTNDAMLTLDATKFSGFEALTKNGGGVLGLSASFDLTSSGTVTVNAGTFNVGSGVTLTAASITLNGAGTKLVMAGTYAGTVGVGASDTAGQVVEISSAAAFAGNVDLGGGTDTLMIDTSGGDLIFTSAQAGYYMNIETMDVGGSNDVNWGADLTFGAATGFQTLKISASGVNFAAGASTSGTLSFMDGATLDLSGLGTGDASLTLTADTVNLPAATTNGGLTILLPNNWADVLTLTIENVMGNAADTQAIVLGKFTVRDGSSTPNAGLVWLVGGINPDYTTGTYTLNLQAELVGAAATFPNLSPPFNIEIEGGYYTGVWPGDGKDLNSLSVIIMRGGVFAPSNAVNWTGYTHGVSVRWHGGEIRRNIDASHSTQNSSLELMPGSGITLNFDGSQFINFRTLSKSSAGSATQTGTFDLGAIGTATISAGTYTLSGASAQLLANALTVSGGTLDGAGSVVLSDSASTFTLSGGTVTVAVDLGDGADSFAWSDGSLGSGGEVDGGDGVDTIALSGSTALTLDTSKFDNFEALTMANTDTVTQDGDLDLGSSGSATFSAGTYSIATGESLTVNSLTVSGGTLSGAGSVTLGAGVSSFTLSAGTVGLAVNLGTGADTFTWSGGTLSGVVDLGADNDTLTLSAGFTFAGSGSVAGGAGSDTIELTGATDITLDGTKFTGFETLTKAGAGTLTLSADLSLTSTGTVTVSAGTFNVASAATLTAASITLNGAETKLVMAGTFTGTVSGDGNGQVVEISSASAFAGNVDLGGGEDTLIIDTSSAALTFTSAQAGYYMNIETMDVSGSNGVTWGADLTFGGATGWQTLKFSSSGITFTAGASTNGMLSFMDGATLDLSGLADADATLTLTADTINLPATVAEGGLTILLPEGWTRVLTLTIENVGFDASDTEAIVLGKFTVADVPASGSATAGAVSLMAGSDIDYSADYTLTLLVELVLEVATSTNISGTFTLSAGHYSGLFPALSDATNRVTNLMLTGGIFNPSDAVQLFGDSTFTWSGGEVRRIIDATDGSGVDTINLQPATSGLTLNLNGAQLVGFEALNKSGAGTVNQTNDLTVADVVISAGTYSILADSSLTFSSSLTLSGGTLSGAGSLSGSGAANTFTWSGGTLSIAVDLGADDDMLILSGASTAFAGSGEVDGGTGTGDILSLVGSANFSLDGSKFEGFEVLTKGGSGTVTQTGTLALGSDGAITISEGTYTISSGGSLTGNSLTVSGGTTVLGGAGSVTLGSTASTFTLSGGTVGLAVALGAGADTFTWSGGTLGAVVDLGADNDTLTLSAGFAFASSGTPSVAGGAGSDTIALTGDTDFTLDGSKFTAFTALTKAGDSEVTLSASLDLTSTGTVAVNAGTFNVAGGATLTAASITLSGAATKLVMAGTYTGTVGVGASDADGQVVEINSGGAFAANVDLGGGTDTLIIDSSSAAVTLSSTQAAYYMNIETLAVSGSNNVTWEADLTFGSSGWTTLKFFNGGITFDAGATTTGALTFSDGATLDLSELIDQDTTLTLTADTITLPSTTTNSGLTIILPAEFTSILTLTLNNVAGASTDTEMIVLGKFNVIDAKATPTAGLIAISGTAPDYTTTSGYTLTLTIEASQGPAVTDLTTPGTFILTSGSYNAAFPAIGDSDEVTNLVMQSGVLSPSNAVALTGDSTLTWRGGRIRPTVDATAGMGVDTIVLEPAMGATLYFDTAKFVGFEALTKNGAGTVVQSGTLALGAGGAIIISAGTYTIGDTFELQGNSLMVSGSGTMLDGDGTVVLGSAASTFTLSGGTVSVAVDLGDTGDNTFTWSGGTLGAAVDLGDADDTLTLSGGYTVAAGGSVDGGTGSNTLVLTGSTDFSFDSTAFSNFQALTKAGNSEVTLSADLSLGASGTVAISAGTFNVASGFTLTAATITLSGAGSTLVMAGTYAGTVGVAAGDTAGQVVEINSASAFAGNVDLGGGSDTLEIDTSGGDLTFTSAQAGYYMNIETMDVSGSNDVNWGADLTFGGATGWQTLAFSASGITFDAGASTNGMLSFMSGATLDLSGLGVGDASLTLTADTVNLPSSGSLTILLPNNWVNVLSLTIENVMSNASDTQLSVLNKFSVTDGSTPTANAGLVWLVGGINPDYTTGTYTLNLQAELVGGAAVVGNTGSFEWRLDAGYFTGAWPVSTHTNFTVVNITGGVFAPSNAVIWTGQTRTVGVRWSGGEIRRNIDVSGIAQPNDLELNPGSGVTLNFDGSQFIGFVDLDKTGAGTAIQTGTLDLGTSGTADVSAGTYTLSGSDAELLANALTVSGGTLDGAGSVVLSDYVGTTDSNDDPNNDPSISSTFTLSGGSVDVAVDLGAGDNTFTWSGGSLGSSGEVDGGAGTDTIALSGSTALTLDTSKVDNFEALTMTNTDTVTQDGDLDLGASGSATFSAGTYSIATGESLTGNSLTVSGGTLSGAGSVVLGTGVSSFILSSGTVSLAVNLGTGDDTFTMSDGTLSGAVALEAGADTFAWSGGSLGSGGAVNAGADSDTIALSGSTALTMAGGSFTNFEVLTMASTATVTQTGTLALLAAGTITISAGTYSISSGGSLTGNALTVSGGILSGAGSVTLGTGVSTFSLSGGMVGLSVDLETGDDIFTWTGGTFITGGDVDAGGGSDTVVLSGNGNFALDGSKFTNFETLTKAGEGKVTQSDALTLTSVTISEGSYEISSGATLTASTLALNGAGSGLIVAGSFTGTVTGDGSGQVVQVSSASAFAGAVDLGGGSDTLTLDTSDGDLTFSATQAGYYSNIETLAVRGGNDISWGAGLTFGNVDGSWQTLRFSATGITFSVTGTLAFDDGATLDLSGFPADADATLALTATTITLPATTTADGLTIELPTSFANVFTLTLTNVMGASGNTENSVLDLFNITDPSGTTAGAAYLMVGTNPDFTTGTYTLSLQLELAQSDPVTTTTSTTFTLTSGFYNSEFPNTYTNLTIVDGFFISPTTAQLMGDSTLIWQNGKIRRTIDATAGAGVDTINLQPAMGATLNFDGSLFTGFEALMKSGAGTATQTGTLILGGSGAITISAGTYSIASSGGELQGNGALTVSGGTLSGDGSVVLGGGGSTFTLSGGTVDVAVDLGAGGDTFSYLTAWHFWYGWFG